VARKINHSGNKPRSISNVKAERGMMWPAPITAVAALSKVPSITSLLPCYRSYGNGNEIATPNTKRQCNSLGGLTQEAHPVTKYHCLCDHTTHASEISLSSKRVLLWCLIGEGTSQLGMSYILSVRTYQFRLAEIDKNKIPSQVAFLRILRKSPPSSPGNPSKEFPSSQNQTMT
jgi:hypothetical protein